MEAAMNKKVSATSARAHTRKTRSNSSFQSKGIFKKALVVTFVGLLAWAYQAIQPPPPTLCGVSGGPLVTAPRIKLSDGRHLAYQEYGVPKNISNYKIIYVHGFDSCRFDAVIATSLSQDVFEDLGVYIVSFDRPGYGESDPNPKRTVKSLAFDIEELADQLELGPKFYLIGFSMGGQVMWSCLKHIPHRLAGVTLLAPVVNYWWPGFSASLSKEVYYQQAPQDQWTVRVAHYLPLLTYWWNTQKWFPSSSVAANDAVTLSRQDIELTPKYAESLERTAYVRQQGEFHSLHSDLKIGFGSWDFDPMDLENPFPNNEGSVHLWQGDEDLMVPATLQRYIAQKLPWIQYHDLPGAGHMFPYADGMADSIIKALLTGDK